MAIRPNNTTKEREILAEGSYPARCYSVIDLGTQTSMYNGEEKQMRKVRLTWEIPSEMRVFSSEKGEQPMVISKEFTLSFHDKSVLKPFLKSRGMKVDNNFDLASVIGATGILAIGHYTNPEGNTYATVNGVGPLMKDMVIPEQINEPFELCLYEFDVKKFKSLPDFLQEKIAKSQEREMEELEAKVNSDA